MLNQIRNWPAPAGVVWIRRTWQALARASAEVFGAHRLLSIPWSLLSLATFNREQFAVLRGRRQYYRNLSRQRRSRTELRRNIHRLKRAFRCNRGGRCSPWITWSRRWSSTRPPSPACRRRRLPGRERHGRCRRFEGSELLWAHNVLTDYFASVDAGHRKWRVPGPLQATFAHYAPAHRDHKPYPRSQSPACPVSWDDLMGLAVRRRSVRWFRPIRYRAS